MPDRLFSDARLAELYDVLHPAAPRGDFGFYLPLIMAAQAVLDVGCGTGALLDLARRAGHTGRLCGLDPAAGMLAQARKRPGIEWVLGDVGRVRWAGEFDLVVMTGHAFQVLISDDEVSSALAAIRAALTPSGRFAFETRNPAARAWERWTPAYVGEAADATGAVVRLWHEVDPPDGGELISFTSFFDSDDWDGPQLSRSTLRFLPAASLDAFLDRAGLAVRQRYGDWDASPLTSVSPEIITIAGRRPMR